MHVRMGKWFLTKGGKIFDLGAEVREVPEIEFKGKQRIYAYHMTIPHRALVPDESKSVNSTEVDGNLIIHDDNLHALKALMPLYAGKVNCIYIDPPYNTGTEGWVYNDNMNSPLMQEWLNKVVDIEDLERHDKWLCMMWPRLQLLKELLSEDGVIFVSIDDNELHHLRMMMDEIFGERNFKNCMIVRRGTKNVQSQFETIDSLATGHDSVLLYSRRADLRMPKLMFLNEDESPGKWDTFWRGTDRPTMRYELFGIHPEEGQWRWSEERTRRATLNYEAFQDQYEADISLDDYYGLIRQEEGQSLDFVRLDPEGTVQYYVPPRNYRILSDVWMDLRTSGKVTDFPHEKHEEIVRRMVKWLTKEDDIVLDSFAGSGTTAHAVLTLNREDGGNRKFILVECEDYAETVTAERVRRVINGIPNSKNKELREGAGGSFSYCTLGEAVDIEGLLRGTNLPTFQTLASYLLYAASSQPPKSVSLEPKDEDGLFFESEEKDYYLLYRPDKEWLGSNEAMLNAERVNRIGKRNTQKGKKAVVFAPGNYMGQKSLTASGILFSQLPYEMHQGR